MFEKWDSKDTALTIQGLGSLAGAWGQYENGKEANKLIKKQLQYEKDKDTYAKGQMTKAQTNLEDAWTDSSLNKKKKTDTLATGALEIVT